MGLLKPIPMLSEVLVLALVLALSAGCEKEEKLTLRQAEGIAYAWLHNVQALLNPKPDAEQDAEEAQYEEEDDDELEPETLRDCFVDDGWSPEGFENPTEAIAWLRERPRSLGKITSIDLIEGVAEVTFELNGHKPVQLVARVVMEQGLPKCNCLKQAK